MNDGPRPFTLRLVGNDSRVINFLSLVRHGRNIADPSDTLGVKVKSALDLSLSARNGPDLSCAPAQLARDGCGY